ncbi:NfeD family protein [Paenibacillus sp. FSL H8-0034]|uniref:NfeD family protein n=1 Tax=Paenibacillus sp. FSL H8-0034 TaxID=2954671 RepID=UPI0030F7F3F1
MHPWIPIPFMWSQGLAILMSPRWMMGLLFVIAVIMIGMISIRRFKRISKEIDIALQGQPDVDSALSYSLQRTDLLGQSGLAITPLRPSGTIAVADEQVDVVTYGEFIPVNKLVVVVQVEGALIRVREQQEIIH